MMRDLTNLSELGFQNDIVSLRRWVEEECAIESPLKSGELI
jgi:hypothetical protein